MAIGAGPGGWPPTTDGGILRSLGEPGESFTGQWKGHLHVRHQILSYRRDGWLQLVYPVATHPCPAYRRSVSPTTEFLDLPSARIHVIHWPNLGAPPILLLHATGFLAMIWRALAEPLSAHYDVYAFDARGHGLSSHPRDGIYGIEPVAADATEVISHFDLGPVYAIGHSMGGAAAVVAAARHPGLIRRIYAFEPILPTLSWRSAGEYDTDGSALATLARKRRTNFPNRGDVLARWARRPPFARWRSDVLGDYVEHGFMEESTGGIRLRCDPAQVEAPTFEASNAFDASSHLTAVRCPVMLASGGGTDPIFNSMLAAAAVLLPYVERETIPGLGHLAPMEDPGVVAEHAIAFDARVA